MSLSLITVTIFIFVLLVIIPLFVSKKAEDESKTSNEWEKIKEYEKKINEKTRNKKN